MIKKNQNRHWFRRLLYSRLAVVLMLILVGMLTRSVYLVWRRERLANQERQAVLRQITNLGDRQKRLVADLALLQTDRGIEEKIRRQFSVAKEGEEVINVVLPPAITSTSTPPSFPWWQPIIDLFE